MDRRFCGFTDHGDLDDLIFRDEEYELKPTINVILRDPASGWYDYRPMLLEDYTPELAAQNRFTDCTVEAMQTLYEDIVG